MKKILYILLLLSISVNAQMPERDSPWDFCLDGNPIGGGAGYDAILTTGTNIVSTNLSWSAFKTLVEARTSGDVVFINSGVTIDLTGLGTNIIHVAGGVTIASDRGNGGSLGALVKTDYMAYQGTGSENQVFETTGTGVRFTGFRFQGPYGGEGIWSLNPYDLRRKFGIVTAFDDTEIDNMELYNWPFAAVSLSPYGSGGFYGSPNQPSSNHLYHHNYSHNNQQNRYGYALNIQYADVKVYGNLFEDNRHDIAGNGESLLCSYEAYCNTSLGDNRSHNFDMHERNDIGGYFIHIHHNDFEDIGANRSDGSGNNAENIRITGTPTLGCVVEFNVFEHTNFDNAFDQMLDGSPISPLENITYNDNYFSGATPPGQGGGQPDITGIKFVNSSDNNIHIDENIAIGLKMEIIGSDAGTLTYALDGGGPFGADNALFTVSNDSILRAALDYENPLDSNTNNIYSIQVEVTSTSTATFIENMVLWIDDVTDEGGEVFVTAITFDDDTQTINVGETVDNAHTFTPSSPTNTGVTFFSGEPSPYYIDDQGKGIYKGTTTYIVRADDTENGTIEDVMSVTINPVAQKSKVAIGSFRTSGGRGKIRIGL